MEQPQNARAGRTEWPDATSKAGRSQNPNELAKYKGKSEAEVLQAIEHVVRVLSKDFTFGYYDQDDISQQIRLYALERMPQYDGERDLANYLYVAVKRRLLNLVRDKFKRSDPPCKSCHAGRPCAEATPDANGEGACERYLQWATLQCRKASLVQPVHWSEVIDKRHADANSQSPSEEAASLELLRMIDLQLPAELRADYVKLKEGVKLPPKRAERVMHALRAILCADPEARPDDDEWEADPDE